MQTMSWKMNDLSATEELFNRNNISYHKTVLFNEDNDKCGYALWLGEGHLEFSINGTLENIVTY